MPRLLKKIFKVSDDQGHSVSEGELRMMIGIGEAEGSVAASEADMLEKSTNLLPQVLFDQYFD